MLRFDSVTKHYEGASRDAVHEFSLDVPTGRVCVLIGPSGCGKSTTLRMINRLIEPDSGRVLLDGVDVRTLPLEELRRGMGYAIQGVGLFPHWTVRENIGIVPSLRKWDRRETDARVDELLELVGLDPRSYAHKYPDELSGGEAQRIGVARALAADPPVLLMDEPFGAVDPLTRDRLQAEFIRIQRQLRKTVVFVTHDMDEAVKLGDHIAVMREGRLVQDDTPERVLAYPADDFVADFVGGERALKRLSLAPVSEALEPRTPQPVTPDSSAETPPAEKTVPAEASLRTALSVILETGERGVAVVDDGRVIGRVTVDSILARFGRPVP